MTRQPQATKNPPENPISVATVALIVLGACMVVVGIWALAVVAFVQ